MSPPIPRLTTPPSSHTPYLIPQLSGETLTIPGSKGVFRILASAAQTNGAMSVFQSDAVVADAPGFHLHNEAHDVFLVTKGFLKLYVGERCLVMGPGDFASVPPKVIHNPHMLGPVSQTLGLITPGDWVDFFRHIGEPFTGLLLPQHDNRDIKALLIPKVMAAKDKFDVVFQRPGTFTVPEVGEWSERDEVLPEGQVPYYLRANTGPRWMLGGCLVRPFITTKQSEGKFAIASVEGSDVYGEAASPFAQARKFPEKTDHVFVVLEGVLGVTLGGEAGGEKTLVREGESVVIPGGQAFALGFESRYVRAWSFASGNGVEALVMGAGERFEGMVLPDEVAGLDGGRLKSVCKEMGVSSA